MARRSTQPRELVRLTPLQFSLSVSIVVLLAAGTGLAGYIYGHKKALEGLATVKPVAVDQGVVAPSSGAGSDSQASVTFYRTLTEARETPSSTEPPSPKPAPTVPSTVTATPTPPATTKSSVMLQVASYNKEDAASNLLKALSDEGYSGLVVQADLGERGVWYRVRVGPYGADKEARRVLEKLREERNLKGFVVK